MIEPILKPAPISTKLHHKCQRIGQLNQSAVTLFVHESVLDEILEFSDSELQRETGGFLLGNLYEDDQRGSNLKYVELQHFLPAVNVVSHSASLKFTHETWSKANNEVASRYPDQRIIGWQHTHPGLGVFLSAYDRFIHQNFFGQDWQIAMVVDPCGQEFAFFQWQEEQLNDCGFIYIPDNANPEN